jgi:hypothetical protein
VLPHRGVEVDRLQLAGGEQLDVLAVANLGEELVEAVEAAAGAELRPPELSPLAASAEGGADVRASRVAVGSTAGVETIDLVAVRVEADDERLVAEARPMISGAAACADVDDDER